MDDSYAGGVTYTERRPPPRLSKLVECIWTLEAGEGELGPPEPVLPDGCIELVFHVEGRVRSSRGDGFRMQPRAVVAGQLTGPLWLSPIGKLHAVGVRFRPGGAHALFRVSLDELTDREEPIEAVLGARGAELSRAVCSADDADARVAAIEAALWGAVERARPSALQGAIATVVRRRGALRMSELRRFGLTGRHLLRRFRAEVGLGPKALCKVLRLQAALALRAREGARWADAAVESGFSDQSHLVRDARALAGVNPAELEHGGPLAAAFRGPQRFPALFEAQE